MDTTIATENNVAGQGFGGLPNPNQPIEVTVPADIALTNLDGDGSSVRGPAAPDQAVETDHPASTPVLILDGDASSEKPLSVDQPVTVGPGVATDNRDGGLFRAGGVPVDVTQDRIESQTFGNGMPANVFV